MDEIIKKVEDWIKEVITPEHILNHHLRTRDFLLLLKPDASIEAQIAALTHDIERKLPGRVPAIENKESYNEKYLLKHGKKSAEHVINFLKKNKINLDLDKIEELITFHECGGSEECDLIKDADSLSFLELLPGYFIKKFKDKDYAEHKFKYMFERLSSKKAKEIAKPLYEKALKLLEV